MAFVVRRQNGSWEIRESISTPAGPRARTLATFRVLTETIAQKAVERASTATSAEEIVDAARKAGAPVISSPADEAAARLLRLLDRGSHLSERMRRILADRLGNAGELPEGARAAAGWAAATPAERGDALLNVLSVADRLPAARRLRQERMPRVDRARQA